MIRNLRRRMTVAHLKEWMDQRFKAVDRRFDTVDKRFDAVDKRFDASDARLDRLNIKMDAGFRSMSDKLSAILRILKKDYDHHDQIVNEHENRLNDLETWRRTSQDTAR